MAPKTVEAVLRVRRGSFQRFFNANPILQDGEITVVNTGPGEIVEGIQRRVKVGDGVTPWRDLPYTIGDEGRAATIKIESTETVDPESSAEVTNVGSETDAVLVFKIPRGEKGEHGDAGTINGILTIGENGNWFINGNDTGVSAESNVPDDVMTTEGTASSPMQVVSRRTVFENHRLFTRNASGTYRDVSSLLETVVNNIPLGFTSTVVNPIRAASYAVFNSVDISGMFNVQATPINGGGIVRITDVVRILAQILQFERIEQGVSGVCFLPICFLHNGDSQALPPTAQLNLTRSSVILPDDGAGSSVKITSEFAHIRAYRNNTRMSS